nr:formate--tetrahydrofolate ligase [Thermoanaerobaculia bacterium]
CLSQGEQDLRERLSRLMVGVDREGKPVTAADLKAVGSMMALLAEAIKPNLVQSVEGVPAFIHGGPFANIAHGCNSVLATRMALAYGDWVITEAGFGGDLGGEKFFDIKCASAGLAPAAVVMVATIRALKRHGGVAKTALAQHDPAAVERGLPNLEKHLENMRLFERPTLVVLNRFNGDQEDEIEVVRRACAGWGVAFAVCDGFAAGGEGSTEAARALTEIALSEPPPVRRLYNDDDPPKVKMETLARKIYGADGVIYQKEADRELAEISRLGYDRLPLCVAKTQMSFSDDASKAGRPTGFRITVRNVVLSAGAGFLVPILGPILRMPGLPLVPQSDKVDLVDGKVVGVG